MKKSHRFCGRILLFPISFISFFKTNQIPAFTRQRKSKNNNMR